MSKINKQLYHVKETCNYCTGENEISIASIDGGHISECTTRCKDCDKKDYWAYGFFESGTEIVSNCEKY